MPAEPIPFNDIIAEALRRIDPAERAAYLAEVCATNTRLREQVEARLRASEAPHSFPGGLTPIPPPFTDRPTPTVPPTNASIETSDFQPSESAGTVIAGRYKLVEELGEGGMGHVFMAQQTEPVKRLVAVKLIKAGMDSKAVLARFEVERQALAMMDHPNIARVFDAGATKSGRPFFVMELVKGIPITKFCDARKLSPRERLELFVPVCQAIQHAHQKGIIHRDIKPSNVLIAQYDDKPVPKVIDFGVAKAALPQLTEHSLVTGFGAVVGTPEYMSPEQASFNQLDIDTRSDVYALGVLLYELLTGTTPLDRKSLGEAALMEILRIVREVEPPRPSDKLSTSTALPSIAANRSVEPVRLTKLLRGELDWIAMKALEKDRSRRYETASGLARDVQRYLADEVVEARPPTAGYRVRKFVRRNKGRVLAAALMVLTLLGGVIGTTLGLFEAKKQESLAIAETNKKEDARRDEAEQRRRADANSAKANAMVYEYFTRVSENKLLKSPLPGLQPLRKELLEAALAYYKDIVAQQKDDPAMKVELARAHYRVGRILNEIGRVAEVEAAQRSSLAVWAEILPVFPEDVGFRKEAARSRLALVLALVRKQEVSPDWEENFRIAEKTFADLVAANGDDADARKGLAEACHAAQTWYYRLGRPEQEMDYVRRAYAEREKLAAADPAQAGELASAALDVGFVCTRQGNATDALRHHERAREVYARLVTENPADTTWRAGLSRTYINIGYVHDSVTHLHESAIAAFESAVREVDPLVRDHPAVTAFRLRRSLGLNMLAKALADVGQSEKAIPHLHRSIEDLEAARRLEPNDHTAFMELGLSYSTLGRVEALSGKLTEGIATLKKASIVLEQLVASNPESLEDRSALARAHRLAGIYRRESGDLGGSRESLERALAVLEDPSIAGRPRSNNFLSQIVVAADELARTHRKSGDFAAAEKAYHRLAVLWNNELGRDPHGNQMARFLGGAFCGYGSALRACGKPDEARQVYEDAVRLCKGLGLPPEELYDLACAEAQLSALPEAGKSGPPADAIQHADEAVRLLRKAVQTGLHKDKRSLGADDLAPLRTRVDFQKLIAEAQKK